MLIRKAPSAVLCSDGLKKLQKRITFIYSRPKKNNPPRNLITAINAEQLSTYVTKAQINVFNESEK